VDELQKDPEGFSERLEEFHELRAQFDAEQAAAAAGASEVNEDAEQSPITANTSEEATILAPEPAEAKRIAQAQAELTLTEKVRKTQADNAKTPDSDLPMPFPPPVQATPLAAPTAQRPASNLPARYGDRSGSGTPDTTSDGAALAPPPAAPWAPQPGAGTQKGPSLKEIQEAEAKKAAKKEEAAAAARKAALEQEAAALREREKAAAAALNSGLPATSTWGTGSPVGAPAGSPWKQPAAIKTGVAVTGPGNSSSKKTLADIQREEEVRKQKAKEAAAAAAAVVQATSTPPVSSMGKRYADLASKTSASPSAMSPAAAAPPSLAGGWATVGAGGKVKVPTGPAVQSRSPSVGIIKPTTPTPAASKPTIKPAPTSLKDAKSVAMEEFKKWLHRELARGLIGVADSELLPLDLVNHKTLTSFVQVDFFAATLLEMPQDPLILAEAVYGYSTTMDGRHFADEFVRRKKLAEKGIIEKEPVSAASNGSNGGWNEVAKKGGSASGPTVSAPVPKEDPSAIPGFRVVPSKKNKGKK
jgi:PERQ amino acid-rich with GYF domain-containing protein